MCNVSSACGVLLFQRDFDAHRALDLIVEHRVSHLSSVPVTWERIASLPSFDRHDLSHLKFATIGGARVTAQVLAAWRGRGVALRQIYGMTEVGGFGTVPRAPDALERPDYCGDGSIFTEFKVVDAGGAECAAGEVGEVLMRGPAVTPGYWKNRKSTDELIVDGWIHSGDMGARDPDGLLKFVERLEGPDHLGRIQHLPGGDREQDFRP